MVEMSDADIERDIINTLVLINGVPSLPIGVSRGKIRYRIVGSDEPKEVMFDPEVVTGVRGHIGNINCEGVVFNLVRNAPRRMTFGINGANSQIVVVAGARAQAAEHLNEVRGFSSPFLRDAVEGRYPTFRQAVKMARQQEDSAYAWSRHFCVTSNGEIYYNTHHAGHLPNGSKSANDIVFKEEYEHLSILMEQNCEKTMRTLWTPEY